MDLLLHLEAGSRQMFRTFLLKKAMPYAILLPVPVIFVLLTLYLLFVMSPLIFWGLLLFSVLLLLYTQNQKILKLMDHVRFLRKIKHRLLKTLVTLRLPEPFSYLLALASWIQLTVFDRLFLHYGRIREIPDDRRKR